MKPLRPRIRGQLEIRLPSGKTILTPMTGVSVGGIFQIDWAKTTQLIWDEAVRYMLVHSRDAGYLDMAAIERDLKRQGISNPVTDLIRFVDEMKKRQRP